MKDKIIFLDRDGVINRFPGMGYYVTSQKMFKFLPNAKKAIAKLTEAGFKVIVISNQGCLSRGLITQEALNELTARMITDIRKAGGDIHAVHYCPHQMSDTCDCKKPGIALVKRAVKGKKVKLSEVFFIGDSREDMQCAKNAGCRSILVLSGRNKMKDVSGLGVVPDFIKKDLWQAAKFVLQKKY